MRITAKTAAPVITFVAIGGLVLTVALVNSGGRSTPRALRLVDGFAARDSAALAPGTAPSSAGGDYQLVGPLPSGTPDDASVWTVHAAATATWVGRLAEALHLGTPVHDANGWHSGGLQVQGDGNGQWWFSPCGMGGTVSSDGAVGLCGIGMVGSGSASGGGSTSSAGSASVAPAPPPVPSPGLATPLAGKVLPPPPTPMPTATDATVRGAADPVLRALGLDPSQAVVANGEATLDPVVAGLAVVGMTTRVAVSVDGTVTSASGMLVDLTKGDSYPLVTAQQAFDALPAQPRMMMCPVTPDGKGCLPPAPQKVTGAHLGLSLHTLYGGDEALVPAWLFEVEGSSEPVAGVAVQPSYLTPPDAPSASTEPSPGPATTDIPTAEPVPSAQVHIVQAARGSGPAELVVRYGASACGPGHVTSLVKESADSVVVFLEAAAMSPAADCGKNPSAYLGEERIALQAPLGDRTVIDGSTGKAVALS